MDQFNRRTNSRPQENMRPYNTPGAQRRRPMSPEEMRNAQMQQKRTGTAKVAADRSSRKVASSQQGRGDSMRSEKTINLLGRISSISIFMLFFGLPLFFLNVTYQGIIFEKQYYFYLWTFIGIVALIAQGMMGGRIEVRRTILDIPIGVFWVIVLISTIFSVDKYHSVFGFFGNPVNGLVSVSAAILAYYLIVSYISKEKIGFIWWAITLSGSLIVLWSFLTTMRFVPAGLLQYISPSLTGSFTSLTVFLGMMLPILIVSVSLISNSESSNVKKKLLSTLVVIIALLDVVTLSVLFGYVQWYVILAAIGLLLVFTISRLVKVSQKTTLLTIGVFLAVFFLWVWGQPIMTRTAIQPEATITYGLSFDVMKESIKNKPIFGSGPGTYGYNFSLHRPKDLNRNGQYDIRFYSDRGVFMESFSTLGLAGAIALIVIVLTYVSTAVHVFMRSHDDEVKVTSLGLFISSVIALLYGMFWAVDGMIILYGILVAALTIGLLRGSLGEGDEKISLSMTASPQYALSFAFLSILVAVGVIFGFVTLGKMFVADIHAGNALRARAAGDFTRSSELFRQAIVLNGNEGRYYTIIGQYGLDLANIELAKPEGERNDEAVAQYISGATGAAATGKDLMPNDVLANETKGFVFENSGGFVSGALPASMSAYERAGELEPFNPYIDIALGKLKLVEVQSMGEDAVDEKTESINAAKTHFDSAREKTTFEYEGQEISLFAPAHYYLSVVEEALGNTDAAIDEMTRALQVTQLVGGNEQQVLSRQINYGFNLARLLQIRGTDEDIENAETLLLQIVGVNDQEVNSHLSLGLLYERQDRRDEAISEYRKILEILPQDDEKARENIQNLIDTIEQGGSNIDTSQNTESGDVQDVPLEEQDDEQAAQTEQEEVSVLIVERGDSGGQAQTVRDALFTQGIESEVREEGDAEFSGVMVMYSGEVNRDQRERIVQTLEGEFDGIESERNDEEVATYNHDMVIVVGTENDES